MRRHEGESADDGARDIPWVRKRDGSIVGFDAGRLASSLTAAQERIDSENPAFVAQELAGAVTHFLIEEFSGQVPTTEEIAETVVKVLREMGYGATASVYLRFRQNRAARREQIFIESTPETEEEVTAARPAWDRGKVIQFLENDMDLDLHSARDIASSVERRLLATELSRVTPTLIDELVYAELLERGLERPWSKRRSLGISGADLWNRVDEPAERLLRWSGHEVLERFGKRELYSRDIAGLLSEGLLTLEGDASPFHWSALSADLETKEPFESLSDLQDALDRRLEERARDASIVVVAPMEHRLARLARGASPESAAKELARMLGRYASAYEGRWIVRLSEANSAPPASAPDMFHDKPSEMLDRWASDFDMRLVEAVLREGDLQRSVRFDISLGARENADELAAWSRKWSRWMDRGACMAFTFGQSPARIAEGFASSRSVQGVTQFVGIDFAKLLDRLSPLDDETLLERAGLLCESAVRLGLQKREFLRRKELVPDRHAALVVVPLGLSRVVEQIVGPGHDEAAREVGSRLIRRMIQRLTREARPFGLACLIDSVPFGPGILPVRKMKEPRSFADARALLESAGGGTLPILSDFPTSSDELTTLVLRAADCSVIDRIAFAPAPPPRQGALFE